MVMGVVHAVKENRDVTPTQWTITVIPKAHGLGAGGKAVRIAAHRTEAAA
jgi:hypothetical protein